MSCSLFQAQLLKDLTLQRFWQHRLQRVDHRIADKVDFFFRQRLPEQSSRRASVEWSEQEI